MTWFERLRVRWGKKKASQTLPPEIWTNIDGKDYKVTEWARAQAERNMRADPEKRAAVERLLISQWGEKMGRAEARRRYPLAGWDK